MMVDAAVVWAGMYVESKSQEVDSTTGKRLYPLEYILRDTDMSRNLDPKGYFKSVGRGGLRVRKA